MQIAYTGDEGLLTIGTGPDHGQFDLYINDNYWRRFDAYTAQPGEQVIHLPQVVKPDDTTTGKLTIEVRADQHWRSTGHVFRFKQLAVIDTTHTDTTIDYTYDALSRLLTANYDGGAVEYTYGYDLAGNLTNNNGTGQPPVVRTYNAANQLTNDGTNVLTYDANGNLTSDGTNTYTWDRANRLAKVDNGTPADLTAYAYDGLNNRISQSIGTTTPIVTQYLLDTQPGLTKVLAATTGANTEHYIHNVRGIHAMESHAGDWSYMAQDGLGSVRSEIDSLLKVSAAQNYAPYGEPFGGVGNFDTPFAFTGELRDANGLQYHRARYYHPSLGVFNSRDPFEGITQRPMSLNGYSWVEGNPIMHTDPSGEFIGIGVAIGIGIATIVAGGIGLMIANPCSHPNYRRAECEALAQALQDICMAPFNALNRVINPPGVADPDREYYPGNPLKNPPIWTPVPTRAPSPPPKTPTPTPGLPFPSPYDLSDPNPGGTPAPTPGTKPQPQPQPTRVLTPAATEEDGCDPQAFSNWWNGLPGAPTGGTEDFDLYEERVARGVGTMGTSKRVPTGTGKMIDADGADPNTCRFLEAKHNRNVNKPTWSAAGFFQILDTADDEIRRYALAIDAPDSQAVGLEIRTNTEVSRDYFLTRFPLYGLTPNVDAFSVYMP